MGPFAIFALILIGVYWIGRAIGLFDELIGDGQSLRVFLEIMLLFLPQVVAIVLPVGAFAATLFVNNRLHSESEMVVMQAAGLSPMRLLRPYVMFSLLVAALAAVLSHYLVPRSMVRLAQRQFELTQDMGARLIVGGRFLHPSDGVTFFVGRVGKDGSLYDIFLYDQRAAGRDITYTAKKAVLVRKQDQARLVMYQGLIQTFNQNSQHLSKIQFKQFLFDVGTLTGAKNTRHFNLQNFGTLALLNPTPEMIKQSATSRSQMILTAHQRIEQPLQSLVYPLIGMAFLMLGGFSRFGVLRQVLAAVAFVIALSTLAVMLRGIVRNDIGFWPLLYLPDAIGLLTVYLLLRTRQRPMRRRQKTGAIAGPA